MEQTIDEKPTTIPTKPRNGFIAFLLSLPLPGLGQVYNGQPKKAIIFFGLLLFIPLVFGLTRGTTFFYGLFSLFIIEVALRIYIIIDGVRNAKRQKEYTLKPYNTWYYHLLIAIGMLAILLVYDISTVLGTQTFKIPTTSNNPTFQLGDWLVADMRAYKNNEPDYGDIVVYSRPDGQIYTFRVVGRPNDNIEIIDNIVSINGKPSKATFIKETTNDEMPVFEYEEELPNGHKHLIYILKVPYDSTKTNIKNIVVPSDSYYLLGDNRDNAADSRYEGFISKDRIKGRIIYSYWGQTGTKRMNIDFTDK
jgi:signal peptidase I